MSNHDTKSQDPREKPCYLCGNSNFNWGRALTGNTLESEKKGIYFRPMDAAFEDGDIPVYARHCDVCGNIILFSIES